MTTQATIDTDPYPGLAAEPRHRIGDVARRTGVSASALRLWERQGLISPTRTASGYRLYSDADVSRLQRVRRMRGEHLNAPGILRMLQPTRPSGQQQASTVERGRRLRALRKERGHSLQEAATAAGLSASFLSALERGATGASVATLHRLTRAYGVTMLELFDARSPAGRRVRPRDRQQLALGAGVRIEQLAVGARSLEPQLFTLGPGATSEEEYAHEGEEFVYVLEGGVTFWIGTTERYRLGAGDALTFPSTIPHRWRNRADGDTRLLWINTPPTF